MKKKSKEDLWIKAEVWEIYISDGVMDLVHGFSRPITEVYIPRYHISFNLVDDIVHVFRTYDGRYANKEASAKNPKKTLNTRVLKEMAETLNKYLKLKDQIDIGIKDFYNETRKWTLPVKGPSRATK